jgi:hypothetical protein
VHPYIEDCIAQKEPLIKVSCNISACWIKITIVWNLGFFISVSGIALYVYAGL